MKVDKKEKDVLREIEYISKDLKKHLYSNDTYHSNSSGRLIKGCRICNLIQSMTFIVGYRCNADCDFCFAPSYKDTEKDYDERYAREACFKEFVRKRKDISGIGITGGEPFLYMEEIGEYIKKIRKIRPDIYLWIYTNGIKATKRNMYDIKNMGIDEIRFNLAASGYNGQVIGNLAKARQIFSQVAVEVPAYPEHKRLIMECLDKLELCGIDQLTLQEILVNENNSDSLRGDFYSSGIMFNKKFFLYGSRKLSYEILSHCIKKRYSFTVNECSSRKFGKIDV